MFTDYSNYIRKILDSLNNCGVEIPFTVVDYPDMFKVCDNIDNVLYYYKILNVAKSEYGITDFILPLRMVVTPSRGADSGILDDAGSSEGTDSDILGEVITEGIPEVNQDDKNEAKGIAEDDDTDWESSEESEDCNTESSLGLNMFFSAVANSSQSSNEGTKIQSDTVDSMNTSCDSNFSREGNTSILDAEEDSIDENEAYSEDSEEVDNDDYSESDYSTEDNDSNSDNTIIDEDALSRQWEMSFLSDESNESEDLAGSDVPEEESDYGADLEDLGESDYSEEESDYEENSDYCVDSEDEEGFDWAEDESDLGIEFEDEEDSGSDYGADYEDDEDFESDYGSNSEDEEDSESDYGSDSEEEFESDYGSDSEDEEDFESDYGDESEDEEDAEDFESDYGNDSDDEEEGSDDLMRQNRRINRVSTVNTARVESPNRVSPNKDLGDVLQDTTNSLLTKAKSRLSKFIYGNE